jgi:hypothetical protein
MDTGKIIASLVREYTAEAPNKLAVYYHKYRISMRGSSFLFEIKDEYDIYTPMFALSTKTAAECVLYEMIKTNDGVVDADHAGIIELRTTTSSYVSNNLVNSIEIMGRRSLLLPYDTKIIARYLMILESECSITL